MKILLIATTLIASFYYSNARAQSYSNELFMSRAACIVTLTYEDESKCFRAATEAILRGLGISSIISAGCLPTATYESESKCYRTAVDNSGVYYLQTSTAYCRQISTWQGEAECFRNYLNQYWP